MTFPSRSFVHSSFVVVGLIGLGLAACNSPQSGVVTGIPSGNTAAATSSGLGGGNDVAIVSPALARTTHATVTYDAGGVVAAPDTWSILPGVLRATFSPALRATNRSGAAVRITRVYALDRTAAIRNGYGLVVIANYGGGEQATLVVPSRLDLARHRVIAELPASLVGGIVSLTVALGVDNVKRSIESPGARYWDSKEKKWSTTGTIRPNEKTLVLIHGIFSSVESAFPSPSPRSTETPCPQRIADAGGFTQVLGFDYEWNEPPYYGADRFARFLKQVADAGVTSATIEAHSYGSVVTLAALPLIDKKLTINNVVTLGGPLPLRGTPLAKADNNWRMGMVLGLLDWFTGEPPSAVDRAFDSGMVASLRPGSVDLKRIVEAIGLMQTKPHFIEVAGTKWICFIGSSNACFYSEETFKNQLVEGSGVTLPWDGVVETLAARSDDIPHPTAKSFDLSHIDLECKDNVIQWVGGQLDAGEK